MRGYQKPHLDRANPRPNLYKEFKSHSRKLYSVPLRFVCTYISKWINPKKEF